MMSFCFSDLAANDVSAPQALNTMPAAASLQAQNINLKPVNPS
jgi:hypothetical protein